MSVQGYNINKSFTCKTYNNNKSFIYKTYNNNKVGNKGNDFETSEQYELYKRKHEARYDRADTVNLIANNLCKKFDSPESHAFYCKAAWHMSPAELYALAEYATAKAAKTPARYFGWLVTQKLRKLAE